MSPVDHQRAHGNGILWSVDSGAVRNWVLDLAARIAAVARWLRERGA